MRVVSMPSWDLFDAQSDDYRAPVLPPDVPTLAVEAGVSFGWERYADDVVSIDRFGASAPGDVVMRELGYHTRARRRPCRRAARPSNRRLGRRRADAQPDRTSSSTSGRAPGTTTSRARCATGGLAQAGRRATASAGSRRTRRSSRRRWRRERLRRAARARSRRRRVERDAYWDLVTDDIATRRRRPAPGLRRNGTAATASCRSRSRPISRTTPRGRSRRPSELLGRVDRPNVMIKIPATAEGIPAIAATIDVGHQRQRHADLQPRAPRRSGRGVLSRARAPGAAATMIPGSRRSRRSS